MKNHLMSQNLSAIFARFFQVMLFPSSGFSDILRFYGNTVSVHIFFGLRLYVDDVMISLLWSSPRLAGTFTEKN